MGADAGGFERRRRCAEIQPYGARSPTELTAAVRRAAVDVFSPVEWDNWGQFTVLDKKTLQH